MANMQQIQLKFDAIEDSLLLRVSSTDDVEFRFWMTRRFVNLIWPALQKVLSETPRIQTQSSLMPRQAVGEKTPDQRRQQRKILCITTHLLLSVST